MRRGIYGLASDGVAISFISGSIWGVLIYVILSFWFFFPLYIPYILRHIPGFYNQEEEGKGV